jgi:hypothetical protein
MPSQGITSGKKVSFIRGICPVKGHLPFVDRPRNQFYSLSLSTTTNTSNKHRYFINSFLGKIPANQSYGREISGSHSGAATDTVLLQCYALSFRIIATPSPSPFSSPDDNLDPRALGSVETSVTVTQKSRPKTPQD